MKSNNKSSLLNQKEKIFKKMVLCLKLLEVSWINGGGSFFFPVTMGMTPILDIAAQLVLPENFSVCQGNSVPLFHLVYNLHWKTNIATAPLTPIMVAKPPIISLNLLFVVWMPILKGGGTLPHILSPALFACGKVDYIYIYIYI